MFLLLSLYMSCGHSHELSDTMKAAILAQNEGIAAAATIDSLIKILPWQERIENVQARKKMLLDQMIEIKEAPHDHANCNHNHTVMEYDVTEDEMLGVQQAWRDSILVVLNELKDGASE